MHYEVPSAEAVGRLEGWKAKFERKVPCSRRRGKSKSGRDIACVDEMPECVCERVRGKMLLLEYEE